MIFFLEMIAQIRRLSFVKKSWWSSFQKSSPNGVRELPMVNLEVAACYFFFNMCGCVWGCGWATNIHACKWSSMHMCILSFEESSIFFFLFLHEWQPSQEICSLGDVWCFLNASRCASLERIFPMQLWVTWTPSIWQRVIFIYKVFFIS